MTFSFRSLATGAALLTTALPALAQDLTEMTIATGVDPSFAPFYIAKSAGIFEENGLDVTVNTGPSGSAMVAFLVGNQINAAYGSEQAGISAHAVDDNVVAVADGTELIDWLSVVGSPEVTDLDALKGKKLGVAVGTGSESFWLAVVDELGLDAGDYEIVNVEAPEMVAALERGNIDAFAAWEPWPTRAVQSIADTAIVQTNRGILNNHNFVYMNRGWIEENTEAAQAFMTSMREAVDFIEANPDEAAAQIASFLSQPKELIAELLPKVAYPMDLSATSVGNMDIAIKQLEGAGRLEPGMTGSDMLYPALMEAVAPDAVTLPE